jgi:hypothetical protein
VVLSNEDTADLSELAKQTMQLAFKEKYLKAVEITQSTPEPLPGAYSDELLGLYYSRIAGPLFVDHDGVNYILSTLEDDYTLIKTDAGQYSISAVNPEDKLNGLLLTLSEVEGYNVFIAEIDEEEYTRFLFAQKLPDTIITEIWTDRVGEYHIVDDHDRALEQSESNPPTLSLEDGVLMFDVGNPYILIPIDDDHAYIAGLGRGLGGTISFHEEQGLSILTYSGIEFVKEYRM